MVTTTRLRPLDLLLFASLAAVACSPSGRATEAGSTGREGAEASDGTASPSTGSSGAATDGTTTPQSTGANTGVGSTTTSTTTDSVGSSGDTTTGGPPPTVSLHTVIYGPGPGWDPKLPPEEQDLDAHFAYIRGLFDDGVLLANGPFLDDGRGFYLHLAERVANIDAIIKDDPAVQSGVLALDTVGDWTLLLTQIGEDVGKDAFFVLNYHPGPNWAKGMSLEEQPGIDKHLAYVGAEFADGNLLAGGPIDNVSGRYIVALLDAAAADAWVEADPSIAGGLFIAEVKPWLPLLRQSVP